MPTWRAKDGVVFRDTERQWRWLLPEFVISLSPSPEVSPSPSAEPPSPSPSPGPSPSPSVSPPPPFLSDRYELCPDYSPSPSPIVPSISPLPSFIHNSDRYLLCESILASPSIGPIPSGSILASPSVLASASPSVVASPSPSTALSPSPSPLPSPSVYASPSPCALNLDAGGWYCVTKLVYDDPACDGDPSVVLNGICVLGQTILDEYSTVEPCDCFERESTGQGIQWIIFWGPFVDAVACSFYCGSLSSFEPSFESDEYEPCISPSPSPLPSPSPILPSQGPSPSPVPAPSSCPTGLTGDYKLANYSDGDIACDECAASADTAWNGVFPYQGPCQWNNGEEPALSIGGGDFYFADLYLSGGEWRIYIACLSEGIGEEYEIWDGSKATGDTPEGTYTLEYSACLDGTIPTTLTVVAV